MRSVEVGGIAFIHTKRLAAISSGFVIRAGANNIGGNVAKTAYIAGGITGVKNYKQRFLAVSAYLRSGGYDVINPVELDERDGTQDADWLTCMWRDLKEVATRQPSECWVLDNWRKSPGARVEVELFRGLGIPVIDYETQKEISEETICQEAQRLVMADRGADYGHPIDDFNRTAKLWEGILGIPVTAEQVGMCMIGVKLSRLCNKYKRDSVVDIAGYAQTLELIAGARKRAEEDRVSVGPIGCQGD